MRVSDNALCRVRAFTSALLGTPDSQPATETCRAFRKAREQMSIVLANEGQQLPINLIISIIRVALHNNERPLTIAFFLYTRSLVRNPVRNMIQLGSRL